MADYPFTNWYDFYVCLGIFLSCENRDELESQYPKYYELMEDIDDAVNSAIKHLLDTGCSPQEGLHLFVKCIMSNTKNAHEYDSAIYSAVDIFYNHGARYEDINILLEVPPFEYNHYQARGLLIDALASYGMNITGGIDWGKIETQGGEDIFDNPKYIDMDVEVRHLIALKDFSEHLSNYH